MNHPHLQAARLRRTWIAAALLAAAAGAAQADIVTLGPNAQPLVNCPWNAIGLPGVCLVQTAGQVVGTVSDFSQVRIGRGGDGSLSIGGGATLLVNRTNLATTPVLVPSVPDVVVGDDVGASGSLVVSNGGKLQIDISSLTQGGLLVGAFNAPAGFQGPSTTVAITDGGRVTANKQGGPTAGAAVGVGYAAGSNSSLLMDGGIEGFGNQAKRPRLDTTGNLSIGREGIGSVSVFRNADVTAHTVYMSTIGLDGQSSLLVGVGSTLTASVIYAGIGLGPNGFDPANPNHGNAQIATKDSGWIQAAIVLGSGGTLSGTGTVGSVSSFGGTVKPGFSPGTMHIDGNFADVGGQIVIEIGANGSDFIDVAGDLSLDGTSIEFKFVDGFAPDAGFSYDFIDADGSVDLSDVHYSFSGLQPGFSFEVNTDPVTGLLSFVALVDGSAVPEPALPGLLGLAGLAAWAARRRSACRASQAPITPCATSASISVSS